MIVDLTQNYGILTVFKVDSVFTDKGEMSYNCF